MGIAIKVTAAVVVAGALVWVVFAPHTYDQCVFKYIKAGMSDRAAGALLDACQRSFPERVYATDKPVAKAASDIDWPKIKIVKPAPKPASNSVQDFDWSSARIVKPAPVQSTSADQLPKKDQ